MNGLIYSKRNFSSFLVRPFINPKINRVRAIPVLEQLTSLNCSVSTPETVAELECSHLLCLIAESSLLRVW